LLNHHIFLPNMNTIDCNENHLTASGQELAGKQLFSMCLGFSGTPNDLLPRSLGRCLYSAGDDGRVISTLSNTDVVSLHAFNEWSPTGVLDVVAKARSDDGERPRYHALIDTGALITGMSNLEVAEYLLKNGLDQLEGVVFLNQRDERMVLVRQGFKVIELAQCGLAWHQRFTFYDHVHTVGMDIKQPLSCVACLTLSKDMTFRDYAQGSYRMRGIGKGQKIEILLIPEVLSLIHKSLSKVDGTNAEVRAKAVSQLREESLTRWTQKVIVDVIAWLVLNGISSELKKHKLLCQQNLRNLWRQAASTWLERAPKDPSDDWFLQERTKMALGELRDSVNFVVSNRLPGEGEETFKQKLQQEVEDHLRMLGDAVKKKAQAQANHILNELDTVPQDVPQVVTTETCEEEDIVFSREQVQEQEQEQAQEQENEQEIEEEIEQEVEQELQRVPQAAVERKYARDNEKSKPWKLDALKVFGESRSGPPFYPIADFAVNKGFVAKGKEVNKLPELPAYVLMSENYYRREWRLTSVRRLKNVICFLEWTPSVDELCRLEARAVLSEHQRAQIKDAFEMYDVDRSGKLAGNELQALFKALDLDVEGEHVISQYGEGLLSLDELEREITSQAFQRMQHGRYFVSLSLEEAEHLRASMHLVSASKQPWPANCGFALRCLGNLESALQDSLVDCLGPVLDTVETNYQLESAEQCLRFMNGSGDFQAKELNILLRSLQMTSVEDRLPWWLDVRSCRRRAQVPWEQLPVATVFVKADEFDDLATKAVVSRIRWSLASKRLWPADAFRLLDTDHSGGLTKAELTVGLEWLGFEGGEHARHQIDAVFKFLDKDENLVIDMEEWKAAMDFDEHDWEKVPEFMRSSFQSLTAAEEASNDAEVKKLQSAQSVGTHVPTPLSDEMCLQLSNGRFRFRWQAHTAFESVWNTAGTLAEQPLSIWAPTDLKPRGGIWRGARVRVPLGHVASTSLRAPRDAKLLEVMDNDDAGTGMFKGQDTSGVDRLIDRFMPQPVTYHQLWQQQSSKSLFLWEPVPPSPEFVAVGLVATTRDTEPPLSACRCVPKSWSERLDQRRLSKLWAGVGVGSVPASFWTPSSQRADTHSNPPSGFFAIATGPAANGAPTMLHMPMNQFFVESSEVQAN